MLAGVGPDITGYFSHRRHPSCALRPLDSRTGVFGIS